MTISKCLLALALPAIIASTPALALAANVRSFTVDGIHLGMTPAQVLQVLGPRSRDAAGSPVKPTVGFSKCFDETRNGKPEGTCMSDIQTYVGGGTAIQSGNLSVHFTEDYPIHPHQM